MFNKIKEFFTGSKPTVEATQEVPLTAADVAIKNIKETTAAVDAKVEVAPAVTPVIAEATSAPAKRGPAKEKPWTEKPPAPITTKPRPQSTKAVPAPKRKKPAPK